MMKQEVIKYYKLVIENGETSAMIHYSRMLANGNDIPVNKEEAIKYFKMTKVVENKNVYNLYALILSKNFEISKEEAKYYKIAADKGSTGAMANYDTMLFIGDGISSDKQHAVHYFKMAADIKNVH